MKWYEQSSEVVFQKYGHIFDERLLALIKLDEYYYVDPCFITGLPPTDKLDIYYQYDKSNDYLFEDSTFSKDEFIELEKNEIYKKYYSVYKINCIYSIGSFLFFLEEIRNIESLGEKIPLSLFVYYSNAIKSLGDAIGLLKNIAILVIYSRTFNDDTIKDSEIKLNYEKRLKEIGGKYTGFAKAYRNFFVHLGFPKFFTDLKVAKPNIEDFKYLPEDYIININNKRYKPSKLLDELFTDVSKGLNEVAKYLKQVILNCPKDNEK
jgi:hypothetical protein